jgi:hypothetical protein
MRNENQLSQPKDPDRGFTKRALIAGSILGTSIAAISTFLPSSAQSQYEYVDSRTDSKKIVDAFLEPLDKFGDASKLVASNVGDRIIQPVAATIQFSQIPPERIKNWTIDATSFNPSLVSEDLNKFGEGIPNFADYEKSFYTDGDSGKTFKIRYNSETGIIEALDVSPVVDKIVANTRRTIENSKIELANTLKTIEFMMMVDVKKLNQIDINYHEAQLLEKRQYAEVHRKNIAYYEEFLAQFPQETKITKQFPSFIQNKGLLGFNSQIANTKTAPAEGSPELSPRPAGVPASPKIDVGSEDTKLNKTELQKRTEETLKSALTKADLEFYFLNVGSEGNLGDLVKKVQEIYEKDKRLLKAKEVITALFPPDATKEQLDKAKEILTKSYIDKFGEYFVIDWDVNKDLGLDNIPKSLTGVVSEKILRGV